MKAKIDKNGMLHIERAGVLTACECCKNHMIWCSHKCPLFGEPISEEIKLTERLYSESEMKERVAMLTVGGKQVLAHSHNHASLYHSESWDVVYIDIKTTKLSLCHTTLILDSLIDERGRE